MRDSLRVSDRQPSRKQYSSTSDLGDTDFYEMFDVNCMAQLSSVSKKRYEEPETLNSKLFETA